MWYAKWSAINCNWAGIWPPIDQWTWGLAESLFEWCILLRWSICVRHTVKMDQGTLKSDAPRQLEGLIPRQHVFSKKNLWTAHWLKLQKESTNHHWSRARNILSAGLITTDDFFDSLGRGVRSLRFWSCDPPTSYLYDLYVPRLKTDNYDSFPTVANSANIVGYWYCYQYWLLSILITIWRTTINHNYHC